MDFRRHFVRPACFHCNGQCLAIALSLLLGAFGTLAFGADQDVSNTNDSGAGSLRQAVTDVGPGEDVVFQPDVAGETIDLSSNLDVARSMDFVNGSEGNVTIDLNGNTMTVASGSTISLDSGLTFQAASTTSFANCITASSCTINGLNSTVTANATSHSAVAILVTNVTPDLNITGGLSGTVTANSADYWAVGLSVGNNITITGGLSGTVMAEGGDYAYGLSADTISITDGLSGAVTAEGGDFAYGFSADSVSINDGLSGAVTAEGGNFAYGFSAYGSSISIAGGLSGTVTAEGGNFAYGLCSNGSLNGGDADTPLVITGSVLANGGTFAVGICGYGVNVKVDAGGTLSALSSGGTTTAILSNGSFNDQIELVAGCIFDGDIALGGGTDALTLSGTTGSTTWNGALSGTESVNVTGGVWTLNGQISGNTALTVSGGNIALSALNTYTGGTTVDGGTLIVNGRISGNLMINGGTVSGTGQVGNVVNSGTFAPGNSIGTMTIAGAYEQTSGSTLEIEINDAGQCDLVDTTGAATIFGGTVEVQAEPGVYTDGATYTFLQAVGGRTGAFDAVTDNMAFFDAVLLYNTDDIQLRLDKVPYNTVAQTYNQRAIASYLDAHCTGATGDWTTVLTELNTLTAPQARAAFDAMNGELYGSLSTVGIEQADYFLRLVASRLRGRNLRPNNAYSGGYASAARMANWNDSGMIVRGQDSSEGVIQRPNQWTPWAEGYGVGASIAGNGNASGLGYSVGGMAFGIEDQLDIDTLFGVVGGYSHTYVSLDERFDRGLIDSGQVGVYLHRENETSYTTGIAAYGYNAYDTRRQVVVGDIARSTHAGYGGNQFSFYAEAGRNYFLRRAIMQPYAALQYIQLHQNDFLESGADSLDLSVGGVHADSFRGLLGTRLVSTLETRGGRLLSLEGRALWRHEFLDEARVLDATFAGQPGGAFVVNGVNVDRDAAILGIGTTYYLNLHAKLYVNYDVLASENYTAHAGSGGLAFMW